MLFFVFVFVFVFQRLWDFTLTWKGCVKMTVRESEGQAWRKEPELGRANICFASQCKSGQVAGLSHLGIYCLRGLSAR